MALIPDVEPQCNSVEPWWRFCFGNANVQMELGAETILVRGSGLWWAELVLDEARHLKQSQTKDGAVARGVIFDSNTALACKQVRCKLHLDHPHHHQNAQSNRSSHKKSSCDLHRSDMTVKRFVYKNVYSKVT